MSQPLSSLRPPVAGRLPRVFAAKPAPTAPSSSTAPSGQTQTGTPPSSVPAADPAWVPESADALSVATADGLADADGCAPYALIGKSFNARLGPWSSGLVSGHFVGSCASILVTETRPKP